MSSTISTIATSLMGLLGKGEKPSEAEVDKRCEEIRQAMLPLLDACGNRKVAQSVANKIYNAQNIEALWYLRSAVLAELHTAYDDTTAESLLLPITKMFKGYLPKGLEPRERIRFGGQ